jgi:CRP-like cAMP-binding protein
LILHFRLFIINQMDTREALNQFKLYISKSIRIDEAAFEAAFPYFSIRRLRKGDFFVEHSHVCRYFGYILQGFMRAWQPAEDKEITTCLCNENNFATATTSFLTQTLSNVSIEALEDTLILQISYTDLNQLYALYPFWAKVGKLIAEKELLFLDGAMRYFNQLPAMDRYQKLLAENPGITNRVSLQHIASFLRITPETLSRIRKKAVKNIS